MKVLAIIVSIVLLLVCIVLSAVVLMQESKSAGLSGAIGGGAEQLFGKKRSSGYDALLSKIATVTAVLFIIISIVLVAVE